MFQHSFVTIDAPTGPGIAVPAQATATVENGKVTVVTVRSAGSQYKGVPSVSFSGGGGSNAAATAQMRQFIMMFLKQLHQLLV